MTANPGAAQTGHGLRKRRTKSKVARFMARILVGLRCARMSVSTNAAPHIPITCVTAVSRSAELRISLMSARAGAGWLSMTPITITPCSGNRTPYAKASAEPTSETTAWLKFVVVLA